MKNVIHIKFENGDEFTDWLEDLISTAERMRMLMKKMPSMEITTAANRSE